MRCRAGAGAGAGAGTGAGTRVGARTTKFIIRSLDFGYRKKIVLIPGIRHID